MVFHEITRDAIREAIRSVPVVAVDGTRSTDFSS
jgi:reverse gyrase